MYVSRINSINYTMQSNSANKNNTSFGSIVKNHIPQALERSNKGLKDSFLCVFSGPSGVGKDTILNAFNKKWNFFTKVVTCTTRAPRPGEIDGVHYHFLSTDEFKKGIANGEFLEYANVYADTFYGTKNADVDKALKEGKSVMLVIDVDGAKQIKEKRNDAISVFIKPSSLELLKQRLINRGTETPEKISERLNKATYEIGFADQYDAVLKNKNLEDSIKDMEEIFQTI